MAEYRMPSLGADMEFGTLLEWKVKPGDRVKRGDLIAVIGTDKADIDAEVFETGVVERLDAQPGQKLPVGAVLAVIRTEDGAAPERVHASPLARKIATEAGIDLASVKGTGPHGVIERCDVEQAIAARTGPSAKAPEVKPTVTEPVRPPPAAGMRHAIAMAMARSNREIPHYYLETHINLDRALRWLEQTNLQRPIAQRILPAALLIKATASALVEVPELNGFWRHDQLEVQEAIHVGIAISLRRGGLVIPAVHHTDQKSLEELMEAMRDLIARARSGHLRSSELTDATITVTNLGDLGVETVHGVIYPPQVALVGFGRVVEAPWAEGGMIGVRPVVSATLAGDHRATDGQRGARFLTALDRFLQEPEKL